MTFADKLLLWYAENKRDLPWRHSKDSYRVWLSEIIMQQTQISQGTVYYLRFIEKFPSVFDLAAADEQDVLLLWQGLGYYSRARNLHFAAKYIVNELGGKFPEDYAGLLKLKGVGEYTAAAISSFVHNLNYPAIDGNVMRVVSRVFGIYEPINSTQGKKLIVEHSKKIISPDFPGDFNQAMMDFGATQCRPKNPDCQECIFKSECLAFRNEAVDILPNKIKAKAKTDEYFYYFLVLFEKEAALVKRKQGIWRNLYEFPKLVFDKSEKAEFVKKSFFKNYGLPENSDFEDLNYQIKHVLSHKNLYIHFFKLTIRSESDFNRFLKNENHHGIEISDFNNFPVPVVISNFLEDINLFD